MSLWANIKVRIASMILKIFSMKFMFSGYFAYLMFAGITAVPSASDSTILGLGVIIVGLLFMREATKIAAWMISFKAGKVIDPDAMGLVGDEAVPPQSAPPPPKK